MIPYIICLPTKSFALPIVQGIKCALKSIGILSGIAPDKYNIEGISIMPNINKDVIIKGI